MIDHLFLFIKLIKIILKDDTLICIFYIIIIIKFLVIILKKIIKKYQVI